MIKYIEIYNASGYFAGSDGNIYSTLPIGVSKTFTEKRKLKPGIQSSGKYFYVSVKINGKFISKRVHRLICESFHGLPENNKMTCSHIDGNWRNNSPENLCWEYMSTNHKRKLLHGTHDRGCNNSRACLDDGQLAKIRKLLEEKELTHQKISDIFNVGRTTITRINSGARYKEVES